MSASEETPRSQNVLTGQSLSPDHGRLLRTALIGHVIITTFAEL